MNGDIAIQIVVGSVAVVLLCVGVSWVIVKTLGGRQQ